MKRVLPLMLAVLIFFTSMVTTQEKAHANPLALPAAAGVTYSAAGIYTISALMVAGGLAAVGADAYSDDVREHAKYVWDTSGSVFKQAVRASWEASVSAGKTSLAITQDVYDAMLGLGGKVADSISSSLVQNTYSHEVNTHMTYWDTSGSMGIYMLNSYKDKATLYAAGGATTYVMVKKIDNYTLQFLYTMGQRNVKYKNTPEVLSLANQMYQMGADPISIMGALGFPVSIGPPVQRVEQEYPSITSSSLSGGFTNVVRDLAPTQKGIKEINIPLDNFIAKNMTTSEPLSVNDTGKLTSVDGNVYTGDVVWDYPPPVIRGETDVPTLDNPVIGLNDVTVDGTGDLVTGLEIEVPVEDVPMDEVGILQKILELLTTGLIGDFSKIDLEPLKSAGALYTTSFPFSLPWDVGRAFDSIFSGFSLDDEIKFDFDIEFNNKPYSFDIVLPVYFNDWFRFGRYAILLIFDIGIIYAIRKWFGGAS